MSKKLILFLMLLLFGSTSFLRADELTVCDGTATNQYVPIQGFYADAYLRCQYVIPAEQLLEMNNGVVSSMKFYISTVAEAAWGATFQVYMTEVDDTAISAFVDVANTTTVYTGVLNGTNPEMTVTFDTPYNYEGGNLLVGFDLITKGSYKRAYFAGVDASGACVQGNSYSSLATITPTQRNFLPKTTFVYTPGTPTPPPTPGVLAITPNTFTLGERPVNGWMEPFSVRITNGGTPTTITATISNTAGVNAFAMSQEINEIALETGEEVGFAIDINRNAPVGAYTEEFTMFSIENSKDITTIPVTATFYTAEAADIVETAENIDLGYQAGMATFSKTPENLHANYVLWGMEEKMTDAVYSFTLAKDSKFSVTAGDNVVAIYKKVSNFHPTAVVEPVVWSDNGTMTEEPLLAGQYYMIVAGENITTIAGTVMQYPAPEALTAVAPADGATEVSGNIVLTWEGGANATQYQVLFGTSPVNMSAVLDWTMIDDNYGSFDVTSLVQNNTQYFWQIKAKNSNGTVQTVRRGFTTTLTAPNTVTASDEEIFVDGSTLIKWKHSTAALSDLPEVQIGSGTSTSSYLPTYNFYKYSFSEQIYTSEEIGGAGIINTISFYSKGSITRNINIYMANTDKTSFSGNTDLVAVSEDDLVFSGNVTMSPETWVTITLDNPFTFEGDNLLLVVNDLTGSWVSAVQYYVFDAANQAINMYRDGSAYNPAAPEGSATVRAFKNQIIINKNSRNVVENSRSFIGYNVYYGDVKANTELITEKQYLLSNLPYNIEPGHNVSVTAVYDEGESAFSSPVVVKVSGYGTFTGTVTELISGNPVEGVNVSFTGKDEFNNTVMFEGTTNANGVYTINNVKAGNYRGTATLEGMEPRVSETVTLAYEGTETVNFVIHELYKPVMSVYAEELDTTLAKVQWSVNEMISGGGIGGSATTFTEGFENGMPEGWTIIDGNNDGYTWCMTSNIPTTWTYYATVSLDWYRTGSNAICSGSFINGVGALSPNEYLVTPQVTIANGSTFSFWAAAADAGYPADHFGVAVSDNATDWTMVNEWTLTGKTGTVKGGRESRDGNGAKIGTWYNYSVDLSAYAGLKYIAIRHFNCTDQYIMCVDDIELSNGSKNRDVQEYAIYRKAILKENELVEADSVYFGNVTDTLYADFDWNNVEPGLYQYGVSAIYPSPQQNGGRDSNNELTVYEGTASNSSVPMKVGFFDDWTKSQYIIPAADLADMIDNDITAIKFYTKSNNIPYTTVSTFDLYMTEVDNTTISDFIPKSDAQIVFSGTADFVAEGEGGVVTLTFDTPYTYNGGNLLIGCENTIDAGYKFIYFYGQTVSGASVSGSNGTSPASVQAYQHNFIPQTTFFYEASAGAGNDNPVTPITWSNVLPKDIETTVTVNAIVAAGSPEGATVMMANNFENVVYTATLDETGVVVFEDFRKGNYTVTVDLEGYVSNYAETEVSIWNETEINATLTEICKPVDDIMVSVTGYAMWTSVVPADRVAEKYFVNLNGIFVAETTSNAYQLEDLTENEEYTVGVAVVYTTGMSAYVYKTFTYLGCTGVAQQVDTLYATNEDMNVTLAWNGSSPTPPTPPTPPTGDVVVKLTAPDLWGDGSGYQMLLDNTHSLYGTTIPTTGPLSLYCSGNEAIYAQFSHKIPVNADGNCTTSNIVCNNTVEVTIPAGTYDWCITNPTPGDRIWIAASNGNIGGRYNDYVFEAGKTYEFTVSMYGYNDGVDLTISGGKSLYQPNMGIMSLDNRTTNFVANTNVMNAGEGFGAATEMTRDWYYYDNGVNVDAIGTNGGNFWWGIMLPANMYEGNRLTKVAAFDYMAMTGSVNIYQGGTTAPGGASLGQTNITFTGSNNFVEFEFAEPIELDPEQNVWVILYNASGAAFPAAVCDNTGDANGRWVSLDGSDWGDLVSHGINNTFMVRAYIEMGGPSPVPGGIVPNKYNIELDGEIVGATTNQTFTLQAPDTEVHTYTVYYVDANYGISCPMSIEYQVSLNVEEHEVVNSIYPNPTSGDLYINAMNMTRVSIVNTMGQVVYEQTVSGDETKVDMTKYEDGVYMVNIYTENGSSVKRVTVVK